ncbi:sigma-70 family RNA polymerase sigma factor [Piscinibacter sakaiensis]|uniref:sigma-70 family RNA polymerase sigma factor n=1 Tax=Piscinibacter sakaiensis TaxID=1547922 RepID=UPI003AAD4437
MSITTENLRREIVALLPRLRRFGRSVTRHREDADDLVQLAVERALMRSEQWQAGTRLDSWLFRIMQNAWIDELRSRHRHDQTFLPEEAAEHVGSSPTLAQDDAMAIEQAMKQLSEEQRVVVSLVLVEGLSYKEAAQVLGIPIGTLTSRLARARDALQSLLGGPEEKR